MFNQKEYFEINREERFFCSILFSVIHSSNAAKSKFVDYVNRKLQVTLQPQNVQIYLEAAALRDFWNDLGDPIFYSADTHEKRLSVIQRIVTDLGYSTRIIEQEDFFWTSPEKKKLWCPSEWIIDLKKQPDYFKLQKIRWCFNAIPDIMLKEENYLMLIEAKVESSEGKRSNGYNQYETQEEIGQLLTKLVPGYTNLTFQSTTLTLNNSKGLTWLELFKILLDEVTDPFINSCIDSFIKRYYGQT